MPVHPEAGGTPFTVTVANPRWIVTGDPAARFDPETGSYLVLDVAVALDDGALEAFSTLSLGYNSWEFVPDGGEAVPAGFGVTGAESLNFSAGQPTALGTLIAFDAVRGPGTLNLVNADGAVLATWVVPAL